MAENKEFGLDKVKHEKGDTTGLNVECLRYPLWSKWVHKIVLGTTKSASE